MTRYVLWALAVLTGLVGGLLFGCIEAVFR